MPNLSFATLWSTAARDSNQLFRQFFHQFFRQLFRHILVVVVVLVVAGVGFDMRLPCFAGSRCTSEGEQRQGGVARGTRSKTDSTQFFVKQCTRKRRNTTTETAKDDAVSAGKQKRNEKEKERPDARMPVATVGFDGGSR